MIAAVVVADSVNEYGDRLTTFELTLPKSLVAQFNTHRMISRNSASSRAIPTARIIEQVRDNPYYPDLWRRNKKGMQPGDEVAADASAELDELELNLRFTVIGYVQRMAALGAAKEDINRYLEPWMWTTVVATATEWDNYFKQRDHEDAQSAHARLARAMREALEASDPTPRSEDGHEREAWHLPYVTDHERFTLRADILPRISAVRCARVSYGRQGEARDAIEELRRYEDFPKHGHWSPLEMPARVGDPLRWYGNYRGWKPLRKCYGGESGTPRMGTQWDDLRWAWPLGGVAPQDDNRKGGA
jgi:hypothetical protein